MSDNLRAVETPYLSSLKLLLGVRLQTCTDLVIIESGEGSAKAHIQSRQVTFLKKLYSRHDFRESPVCFAMHLAKRAKSPMGLYMQKLESTTHDPIQKEADCIKQKILHSESSRRQAYLSINPSLDRHMMYSVTEIPEYARRAFTRIRLGSHWLKIETGRWSRIDREQRTCPCGNIQTEEHMICVCPYTAHLRDKFISIDFTSIKDVMASENMKDIASLCYAVLQQADIINQ